MARAPTAPSLSRLNRAPGAPGTEEALRKYGTVYFPGSSDFTRASLIELEVRLIPDDRTRRDLYKRVLTDGSGHFIVRGIAPGAYKLFAWEGAPANAHFDPDFMRGSEDKGVAIQISESSRLTRDVQRIAIAPQ